MPTTPPPFALPVPDLPRNRLLQNTLPVVHMLGLAVMLLATAMSVPVAVAIWHGGPTLLVFAESFFTVLAGGLLMWGGTLRYRRELQIRDGFLLVTLVWSVLPAFAAMPLMLYLPELSFTDAYFESISGITTTGATVFSGLDKLPASINAWRCLLQWFGGVGIIVMAVAVLPLLGIAGQQIYRAETPGPMKDNKLTPRITETAKGLWLVYAGFSAACWLGYWLAGMTPLDALMHTFSTMSTGGFSSYDASFGHFNSPAIEAVAVVFMLVGGVNFATHFIVWRRRSLAPYRADPEARWFVGIVLGSAVLIAAFLWLHGVYPDFLASLRHSAFNVVSIATTTGYASVDYNLWPAFAPLLMLFLCCFASCAGSTGGGVKMVRGQLLFLQGLREMVKLLHPQAQVPVKFGGKVVANQIVFAVLAFMSLYGASITVMTFLLLATGLDFMTAVTAIVASITNTGPGLANVGPATTYASLGDFQKWICSFAMLIGRLELFTVLVIFTPAFWRK